MSQPIREEVVTYKDSNNTQVEDPHQDNCCRKALSQDILVFLALGDLACYLPCYLSISDRGSSGCLDHLGWSLRRLHSPIPQN